MLGITKPSRGDNSQSLAIHRVCATRHGLAARYLPPSHPALVGTPASTRFCFLRFLSTRSSPRSHTTGSRCRQRHPERGATGTCNKATWHSACGISRRWWLHHYGRLPNQPADAHLLTRDAIIWCVVRPRSRIGGVDRHISIRLKLSLIT